MMHRSKLIIGPLVIALGVAIVFVNWAPAPVPSEPATPNNPDWVLSLAAVGGNQIIAGTINGDVLCYDYVDDKVVWKHRRHRYHVCALAVSPNGKSFASAGHDGSVFLCDPDTGAVRSQFQIREKNAIEQVEFLSSSQLGVCSFERKLAIWDVDKSGFSAEFDTMQCDVFAFDQTTKKVAIGKSTGTIYTGSLDDLLNFIIQEAHHGKIWSIRPLKDGKSFVSGGADGKIRVWNTELNQLESELAHELPVLSLAVGSDGRTLASGSADRSAVVWDLLTKARKQVLGHDYMVTAIAISPDCNTVITGSKQGITTWNARTGAKIHARQLR